MGNLDDAVARGEDLGPLALYHGCWNRPGHCLHDTSGKTIWKREAKAMGLHWNTALMDGGLLQNGRRPDVTDGKVFWTCGGRVFWYAFFWWDRSGDNRSASNSGFYVRGFGYLEAEPAFDFACAAFPNIVSRQEYPLVLQSA